VHAAATARYHGGDLGDIVLAGGTAWALASASGQCATSIGNIDYSQLVVDAAVASASVKNSNVTAGLSWAASGYQNWQSFGDFAQSVYGGASKYYISKGLETAASRAGLTLGELNSLLYLNSFVGRGVAGSTITEVGGSLSVEGWLSRDKRRGLGVIWDLNDTILGYQGLLDAVGQDYIANYRGQHINVGHSLGSIRSNNLVNLGFAPSASVYSMPFGNVGTPGVNITNNNLDVVNGFFLHRLLNPGATSITSCNRLRYLCHSLHAEYLNGN